MTYSELKVRLSQSRFRSRFHLTDRDRAYIAQNGWEKIAGQARTIIQKRLAPAEPPNDGKQTPMRGAVVFVAQHATACCCRGCLEKWHRIPAGHALTNEQIEYIVGILVSWLKDQAADLSCFDSPPTLFDQD